MGQALGLLRWSPVTFWQATPHEFHAAVEARVAAYSTDTDDGSK